MGNKKKRYLNIILSRKYLLIYIIYFFILINIKDSKGIKIKSFFFSGWDDKKVQDNNTTEPDKPNPIQSAGQDTGGAIPASPVSTSANTGSTSIPNNNGSPLPGLPPFIPPPSPSNNQNIVSHPQNEVLDASKQLEIEQAKSITECCHKAIYGTSKNKSDITESIIEAASNVKPGGTVTLKPIVETPTPADNSNKPNLVTNKVQNAIPSPIGNISIPNSGNSNTISFPNGATFLPLVLDATSGQYGVEFKTMDLLIKGKDEKVKPFDMLIPFVSENGKIKFVTRRRLRQLVKSGLSKGLEASNEKLDDEKSLITDLNKEEVNQNNDKNEGNKGNDEKEDKQSVKDNEKDDEKVNEKDNEKEDKKKDENTNTITSSIEEAESGAKSLLQEAETILTGGSLFETSSNKSNISPDNKEAEDEDEDKSQVSEEEEEGDEDSPLSNSTSNNSSELSSSGENSDIEDSSIQGTEEEKEEDN
ncbi:uncharacterized protein CMU_042960 [Cryptosporidium muris RN66]|uniref:Uncharacterized protein n=1 Tax=Cryptosporidium muris (strain RN66) TaxID=441375 RepID=B6AAI1_CRYMR|nr:uncharacterized protein CMU_042960 [Cryptosporidium muris RN66]EEA05222.1 hypothetical protein, conserved [Cryptosporidium muris RN66]|eukprot:XP_002139571.1 hypothetical protein [Cryptosporidium muris RN66]